MTTLEVYATFEASTELLECSTSQSAKDSPCLLEILTMLHSSVLPVQIFECAWETFKEILRTKQDGTHELYVPCDWHISQLPDFMVAKADQ
jgi:hypothetical protein